MAITPSKDGTTASSSSDDRVVKLDHRTALDANTCWVAINLETSVLVPPMSSGSLLSGIPALVAQADHASCGAGQNRFQPAEFAIDQSTIYDL